LPSYEKTVGKGIDVMNIRSHQLARFIEIFSGLIESTMGYQMVYLLNVQLQKKEL
jgi:hypothetical protein